MVKDDKQESRKADVTVNKNEVLLAIILIEKALEEL